MFRRLTLISLMLAAAICAGAATPQMILIGQPIQGTLEHGDDQIRSGELCDVFWFDGLAGVMISIRLDSEDFDPYLILRHPSGDQTENDDFDGSLNAGMNIEPAESGQYQLVVTSYQPGDTGTYTLSVMPLPEMAQDTIEPREARLIDQSEQPEPSASPQDTPTTQPDPWAPPPANRTWPAPTQPQAAPATQPTPWDAPRPTQTQPVPAPPSTWQRAEAPTPTPTWSTPPTTQPTLAPSGFGGIGGTPVPSPFTPTPQTPSEFGTPAPTPNVMPLQADTTGSVSPSPMPSLVDGGGIALGQAFRGQLSAGDSSLSTGEFMDEWTLQGAAGQEIAIVLDSEEFDTYLIVLYPEGGRAENDDRSDETLNSEVQLTLPESGEYRIVVTSYAPGETGEYLLSVQ
jgi:Bacterial pre-peptidase C-terminal domain